MKRIPALLLALAMILGLFTGCGTEDASTNVSASAPASAVSAQTPDTQDADAPAADESAMAAESSVDTSGEEAPGYTPAVNFPGSDTARLHYSNEYTLPISEEGTTITWMRNQLNLMGPLGELGLSTLQDLDAIQELQKRTGVTIEYTELDFWTAQEKMNIAIASGDYPALISDLSYTGGNTGALEDGIIVDLTDDLSEFSPNYQYMIDSNPEVVPHLPKRWKGTVLHEPL